MRWCFMQVKSIGSSGALNRNFKAMFVQSPDLNEVTVYEIRNNRSEYWQKGLKDLNAIKKDTKLDLSIDTHGKIIVTNLENNNSIIWPDHGNFSDDLKELSNPASKAYYNLFLAGQSISVMDEIHKINNTYYAKRR